MFDLRLIDNQTLAATVAGALRRHVGPGKRFSYAEAAAAIHVTERAMTSWCRGETPPQSHKLIRLMAWLGPGFASEVLLPAGLQASALEPAARDEMLLNRDAAAVVHEFADALADDGRIDHIERRRIKEAVKRLAPRISAYVADDAPHLRVVGAR